MPGNNTKAAITRIADALPFLKAEGQNAIPKEQLGIITQIRTDAAGNASGTKDVQIAAAERWITAELTAALDADNKPTSVEEKETSKKSSK